MTVQKVLSTFNTSPNFQSSSLSLMLSQREVSVTIFVNIVLLVLTGLMGLFCRRMNISEGLNLFILGFVKKMLHGFSGSSPYAATWVQNVKIILLIWQEGAYCHSARMFVCLLSRNGNFPKWNLHFLPVLLKVLSRFSSSSLYAKTYIGSID